MSLETDRILEKGDRVSMTFHMRTNKIEADGEIIRKEDAARNLNRYGIKLLTLNEDARSPIELFVIMHE